MVLLDGSSLPLVWRVTSLGQTRYQGAVVHNPSQEMILLQVWIPSSGSWVHWAKLSPWVLSGTWRLYVVTELVPNEANEIYLQRRVTLLHLRSLSAGHIFMQLQNGIISEIFMGLYQPTGDDLYPHVNSAHRTRPKCAIRGVPLVGAAFNLLGVWIKTYNIEAREMLGPFEDWEIRIQNLSIFDPLIYIANFLLFGSSLSCCLDDTVRIIVMIKSEDDQHCWTSG